ncbi:uncharacterized protein J7T54_005649 [Emericellopsis cladophorae]|uniref:Alpha/beta hydrolase n=1 Tax=Emericellopsis cladophorae TaxID=2686198 RepID=A0A9Q0BGE2_9HYPO|nr:uncharacterized protein J7T54_005649 [Emericellopsis cladophorae]KAI6783620.1 hypothetical protein J7T54_005649 [Emericellopsis cladophorae]
MQDIVYIKYDKKIGEDESKKVTTYGPIKTPKSSEFAEDFDETKLEHPWIVPHGKRRDGMSTGKHPTGSSRTKVTLFDVLDGLIDEFANKKTYPSLTNITLIGHGGGGQLLQRYAQYPSRDVISIVGYDDKAAAGDRSRMVYMQGGGERYINEHARTREYLDGFPGKFENPPRWSILVNGTSGLRLKAQN